MLQASRVLPHLDVGHDASVLGYPLTLGRVEVILAEKDLSHVDCQLHPRRLLCANV
jgi:hypothetical protein